MLRKLSRGNLRTVQHRSVWIGIAGLEYLLALLWVLVLLGYTTRVQVLAAFLSRKVIWQRWSMGRQSYQGGGGSVKGSQRHDEGIQIYSPGNVFGHWRHVGPRWAWTSVQVGPRVFLVTWSLAGESHWQEMIEI